MGAALVAASVDKQDGAYAAITATKLAVQAGKMLNRLSPEAKDKLVAAVKDLC